ncbi:MAG: hypothetical protein HZA28_02470, partial [Candidatus Omnitrophica bacterium]|nr:hypothetical protein [Candidatus Omnitrophota bacterium]
MNKELPPIFLERLKMIAGEVRCGDIIASFSRPDILSVRVNTIKTTREEMISR